MPRVTRLDALRREAAGCTRCDLYRHATQTVFGAGTTRARIMLVGEQPGDREDRAGAPFVGPAGEVLERALHDAGLSRTDLYVTNAVKHFKWTPSPRSEKVRLHAKPNRRELEACRPWLEAELDAVQPQVLVALGVTAAQTIVGRPVRIGRERGQATDLDGRWLVITRHPSSILRAKGPDRDVQYAELVEDLTIARDHAAA